MKISIGKFLGLIIVFVFIITMFVITYSTPEPTPAQKQASITRANLHYLPEGASDVVLYHANRSNTEWKTFKWHGQCFLLRSSGQSAVLTTINCPKEK